MDSRTHKRKASVAILSVISNSILVLGKLIVGLLINSVSIISESIHSGVDLVASIIALFAVRVASKPADEDHQYGHGKVENISGTIEAILIFAAAIWIIWEAYHRLISGEEIEDPWVGVIIMAISVVANIMVSKRLFKVGRETHSVALVADAWHLATDVWTSVGVMTGLGLMWLGKAIFPTVNLNWIDPIAAMLVAILIIRAAYHLTVESARDLMDVRIPKEEEDWIKEYVRGFHPVAHGFHQLRTRKSGHVRFVDFHLLVKADMSVEESHRITDIMSAEIEKQFPHSNVTIHIEPCNGDCTTDCITDCLMTNEERAAFRLIG
ncbi:MAG: cation diffusion facilitator family transporter [bacterium]|nr:cation diffusion facilitator family transporter [bacterium]